MNVTRRLATTYVLLVEPLNGLLKNTSASRVVTEVRKAVLKISEAQRLNLTANAHIGIAMHLSCLIDKKLTGKDLLPLPFVKHVPEIRPFPGIRY